MEERESPAGDGKDEPPLNCSSLPPLPRPPGMAEASSHETYVVRFPKDQVYRVPPPENARIVESFRPRNNQKSCAGGATSFCRLVFIVLVIATLAIVSLIVANLILYNPKSPEFSIVHFHAKNLPSQKYGHGHHNQKPEYSILLRLENPNKRMNIHYGKGRISLNFKGKEIGFGRYSSKDQGALKQIQVVETLHSTKKALPNSIQKSLNDEKHPKHMILKIEVPIKVSSWLKKLDKNLIVTCDFKVNGLAKKSRNIIQSQECRTDF